MGSAQAALEASPADPPPAAQTEPAAPQANPQPAAQPETLIPSGTTLAVRLDEPISTRRNRPGDHFTVTLADPVLIDGQSVLPTGTRLEGRVLVAAPSGRLRGRARLVLALDSLQWEGRRYHIRTIAAARVSRNHKKRNLVAIGGGAGTGASVGALAAGGPGALIGAGAGAVAGTVGAAVTGRKQVILPAETMLHFTLGAPVRV